MATEDPHDVLCAWYKFPDSKRLRRVLELLLTPAEAAMVAALPATIAEVAAKTATPEGEVRQTLDALYHRGVILPKDGWRTRNAYQNHGNPIGLRDFTVARIGTDFERDRSLMEAFYEFATKEARPATQARLSSSEKSWSRLVPAYAAVKDLPDLQRWEDYHEILRAQKMIAGAPCACRYSYAGGDCSHTKETEDYHCLRFNHVAEFAVDSGNGRRYTLDEAIAMADKAEREGLMHNIDNHRGIDSILSSCNCCTHCGFHIALGEVSISYAVAWQKTRFAAFQSDSDGCSGCQTCLDRCYFDAIEMMKAPGSKKLKSVVDAEKCFGCGLCVVGCPQKVLKMKVVRPLEWVPEAPEEPHVPEDFRFE